MAALTIPSGPPCPLLILDGRFVSAEMVAATMAQRPPNLPSHRCFVLVSADVPLEQGAIEGTEAGTVKRLSELAWVGAWLCVGDSVDPASSTQGGASPGWVGYGVLGKDGGWPFEGLPWLREEVAHGTAGYLAPWLPLPRFPPETAQASPEVSTTWIAGADLVAASLAGLPDDRPWSLMDVAKNLEQQRISFRWQVWAGIADVLTPSSTATSTQAAMPHPPATVLAIVPHYRCEPWLRRCLAALVNQTRPPDGIVVVDDGSPHPPGDIVAEFPSVTLLTAPATVGPYRLVQQVIQATAYDYYLFQDADDWSFADRLAQLLATAEQTQADLIGTQELRWESAPGHLIPVHYPLDVNLALAEKPGHPLLHPTSLVRRQLVMQVGGFATGLRFGGDTEFLLRATWVGRILNLPTYGYLRQKRPQSLTTDPHTGLDSPARRALLQALKHRFYENHAAHHQGHPPDLTPLSQAPDIPLQHHSGPALVARQPGDWARGPRPYGPRSTPMLAIIIPLKDRPVADCVESLWQSLAAWEPGTYHLWLCDGGSTQPEVVDALAMVARHNEVTVLSCPDPGFNKAALINEGLRHAQGETVLVSDADILWNPEAIDALLTTLADTPHALCHLAQVNETVPKTPALSRPRYGYRVERTAQGVTVRVEPVPPRPDHRPGCGLVMARWETWQTLGGYKEQFQGWGWEDQDLLIRAELLGIPLRTAGSVLHQSHTDALRNRFHGHQPPQTTRDLNLRRCLDGLQQGDLSGDLGSQAEATTSPIHLILPPDFCRDVVNTPTHPS